MKIKLTTDYAIRVVFYMYNKRQEGNEVITSNAIAKEESIPHGVLMKVLKELRESRIIASHQGRGEISGGYTLASSLKQITILDIVEIMEGPIALENVRKRGAKEEEPVEENGILQEYRRVSEGLRNEMRKVTLYEVLHKTADEK
jgi:Rrf2 family protein